MSHIFVSTNKVKCLKVANWGSFRKLGHLAECDVRSFFLFIMVRYSAALPIHTLMMMSDKVLSYYLLTLFSRSPKYTEGTEIKYLTLKPVTTTNCKSRTVVNIRKCLNATTLWSILLQEILLFKHHHVVYTFTEESLYFLLCNSCQQTISLTTELIWMRLWGRQKNHWRLFDFMRSCKEF